METHSHTPLCKHARGEPREYALAAVESGLRGAIITCHGPLPDGISSSVRMSPEEWPLYQEMVREAAEGLEGEAELQLGVEMDYLPGLEPWNRKILDSTRLSYVLGSVHSHIKYYVAVYFNDDWPSFFATYYQHLAEAAESGMFDCLAHPDIVKNQNPEAWESDFPEKAILDCLDRVAAAGTAMELNTSGRNKVLPEMNPGPQILRWMAEREIPVVVGADAHDPHRAGDNFRSAIELLRECGYSKISLFQNREREDLEIEEVLLTLPCDQGTAPMPATPTA